MNDFAQNKYSVTLPGGVFIDNTQHKEVCLIEPDGYTEEFISNISVNENLANITTILLTKCVKQIGDIKDVKTEFIRSLQLGDRNYLLLKLCEITFGNKVDAIISCRANGCKKKMDISFQLSEIPVKHSARQALYHKCLVKNKEHSVENQGEVIFEFRLPNGQDQELIIKEGLKNDKKAVLELLTRCVRTINGDSKNIKKSLRDLPDIILIDLEKRIKQISSGIDTQIAAVCPECYKKFDFQFNITQWFIDKLELNLEEFYRQIHLIAFYYKWSEQDILALRRHRRIRYSEMINEQLEITMHLT